MSLFVLLAVYLTAAASLAGGAIAALVILISPAGSMPSKPAAPKMASADPAKITTVIVEPDPQKFRYGPAVNHGRGDTPVYASQQALREARALAPSVMKRRRNPDEEPTTLQPGVALGFAPSVPSSGQ